MDLRIWDVIDVLVFAYLIYIVYRLTKGTVAFNIIIGVILFLLVFVVVRELNMRMLQSLLGGVASIGVLALIIIFQPEIRRFLLLLGNTTLKGRLKFLDKFFGQAVSETTEKTIQVIQEIMSALRQLSRDKTGALIVLTKKEENALVDTGKIVDARLSRELIENLFYKNAPLHDGATIIRHDKILAARCILPISSNSNIPPSLGLRHRAAVGASEASGVLVIVVSEQNGQLSYASDGKLYNNVTFDELKMKMNKFYTSL